MDKKLLFVFNPHAGKGQLKNKLLAIVQLFTQAGYEVTVRPTLRAGEIPSILQGADGRFDLVVTSGGDGTLNETVAGIMSCASRPLLGYIPAGTVNDFAASLRLPREPLAAARLVVEGRPFRCDIGAFNDRHFAYVAAFGAFTQVSYATPQPYKNVLGRLAYVLEGVRSLPQIKSYQLTVEYGGHRVEGRFLLGLITNSTSVGGFRLPDWTDTSMSDGLLEVFFVREPRSSADLQNAINTLLSQRADPELILRFQAEGLKVTAAEPLPWTLDGEFGGNVEEASIHACREAISIQVKNQEQKEAISQKEVI